MLICTGKEVIKEHYLISYLNNAGKGNFNAEILAVTYIKEDCVSVGVSIICINAVESLRELDIADLLPSLGVHQETHGLSRSFAVVDIVITVQV